LHGWRRTLQSNTPAPAATRLQAAFLALSAEIAKRAQTDEASTNLDRVQDSPNIRLVKKSSECWHRYKTLYRWLHGGYMSKKQKQKSPAEPG